MASSPNAFLQNQILPAHGNTTTFRRPNRSKIFLRRRKKLPTQHLGGKKRLFSVRIFHRVKLKRLKLQYFHVLKKLKKFYKSTIKEIIDARTWPEDFQQRVLFETSLAVPVMGVSFYGYRGWSFV
ncbi:hypothetical protein Nepgr_005651 [Nepenthes gracilis]|uniref:Uncharacterized protein n=1 Tax=Nepenthes gracilis TaxID=150966 RepID=A0AAD3S408_NEPGR|nr:hypothetical protein Nepgr_005651 [Nepenthes gracilis]